ncbi:MAG: BlaI/MecI/CopY family transcriptional regulator [Planctomycetota bacterium]
MSPADPAPARRERQILEILYRLSEASAQEVLAALEDPPSYSAVRATLRIMEEKGLVAHREDGPRYLFRPRRQRDKARASALRGIVRNFFAGSSAEAIAALLNQDARHMSAADLTRLEELVRRAKQEGR